MSLLKHPVIRVFAAATLLAVFAVASPTLAASGDLVRSHLAAHPQAPEMLAQAATAPSAAPEESASTAAKANAKVDAKVEARITAMRKELQITEAQEPQWNALTKVMRDNAHAIADIREEGTEQTKSMNAIDQIKSYSDITDAQAAGIHKFLPAFQALYDTMSDSQKQIADTMFRSRALAAAKKHAKK
jgi:hypothetical protein